MDWDVLKDALEDETAKCLLSYDLTPSQIGYCWWTNPSSKSHLIAHPDPYAYPPGAPRPSHSDAPLVSSAPPPKDVDEKKRRKPDESMDEPSAKRSRSIYGPTINLTELPIVPSAAGTAWHAKDKLRRAEKGKGRGKRPPDRFVLLVSYSVPFQLSFPCLPFH